MIDAIHLTLTCLAALVVLFTTIAPMTGSHAWWIRGWDFPRVQIAVAAFLVFLLAIPLSGWPRWTILVAMAVCGLYQAWRIFPFTPLAGKEIAIQKQRDDDIRAMAINVEMTNDDFAAVIRAIEDEDPDILFLMETNQAWVDALEKVLARYDTVLREPQENYYGLVFATRLKVREAETVQLTVEETPTVFATLEDRAGRVFRFVGLHPQPPVPGVDTEERDAQTLYGARFARKTPEPVIVMGDFNDACWADSAQLFKTAGEYVDVRAGRGLYASFHARHWWFRCPIDQLYLTEGVALTNFEIGPYVGSDHFPVIARVNFDPDFAEAGLIQRPILSPEELKEVESAVERHRARLIDHTRTG